VTVCTCIAWEGVGVGGRGWCGEKGLVWGEGDGMGGRGWTSGDIIN
jgi:hypothetical protein